MATGHLVEVTAATPCRPVKPPACPIHFLWGSWSLYHQTVNERWIALWSGCWLIPVKLGIGHWPGFDSDQALSVTAVNHDSSYYLHIVPVSIFFFLSCACIIFFLLPIWIEWHKRERKFYLVGSLTAFFVIYLFSFVFLHVSWDNLTQEAW